MTQKLKSTNFTQLTWELQKMFGLNTWTAQRLAHAHCHKLRDGRYHLVTGRARDFLAAL